MSVKRILSLVAVLGFINCGGADIGEPDQTAADKADSVTGDTVIKDYAANKCDLFVDKVISDYGWNPSYPVGEMHSLRIFVKLSPEMAEKTEKVMFYGKVYAKEPGNKKAGWFEWTKSPISGIKYFDSKDYYELTIPLLDSKSSEYSSYPTIVSLKWEGAFYAETKASENDETVSTNSTANDAKKTVERYWLNKDEKANSNFTIDGNTFQDALRLQNGVFSGNKEGTSTYAKPSVDSLIKTADFAEGYYLNPSTCR